jgi:hypothetical protein
VGDSSDHNTKQPGKISEKVSSALEINGTTSLTQNNPEKSVKNFSSAL